MLRHRIATALGISLFLTASAAAAQSTGGDRAIELGRAGVELYQAKRWGECVAKLEAADAIVHSPVFDLYRARCMRGEGRLLRARALFDAVSRETLAPDAPAPWVTAKADAARDLADIQKLVPSVVVTLAAGDAEPATIDGQKVAPGAEVDLDPGLHKLVFVRGGADTSVTFEVVQGERGKSVSTGAPTPPPGEKVAPGPALPPPPEKPGASSGSVVPGAVLTAIGGAALVVGGIFGGLALDKYGTIDDNCPENRCGGGTLDEMNALRDDADVFADASTGLLIGGGIVAAVGVVLLIVRPGGDDATTAARTPFVVRF